MDTRLQNQLKAPSPSSVFPMHRGLFQPRSFTEPEREDGVALHSSHQPPDLQAQLDRAARFGHNFGRVQVQANPPAVIQPQHDIRRSEEQQDEQAADFLTEPIKRMAPSLGQPIQPESLDAQPIQMMPHPSLLTSLVQRESLEAQPIQMMPQLGLRSPVIQREVEEVEPIQRIPQLGLYSPVIQREVEEVEPIQRMPQWGVIQPQEQEVEQEPIQTKLVVGAAGDKYEQEADSVAAQVMSMNAPSANTGLVQRQGEEEKQEPLVQRLPMADSITPLIQRQSEEQEEAIQPKSLLQRAGAKSNNDAGSGLENKLNGSKGGGSPLPGEVRSFMEPRFGTNFSAVRVHTDSSAVQMNKELGAQAFAHGKDIYYGAGKSPGKDALTAHELTHTIQQTGGVRLNQEVRQQHNPEQLGHDIQRAASTSYIQRDVWDPNQHAKEQQLQNQQNARSDQGGGPGAHPVRIGAEQDPNNPAQTQGDERHIDDDMLATLTTVLNSLPASHINGNPALARIVLKSDTGGGASFFGGDTLTLIVPFNAASWVYLNVTKWPLGDLATTLLASEHQKEALTRDVIGTGSNLSKIKMVPEKFVEWMIRHEVGHSVDAAIGWHDNKHYRDPACGAWEIHDDKVAMVNTILAAVGLAGNTLTHLDHAFNPHTRNGYDSLLEAVENRNATILTPPYRRATLATFERNVPGGTRMVDYAEEVIRRGLASPYENGGGVRLNNRTYHYDPQQRNWVSYQSNKYDLRDSNYQFQSPGEWFAETYSRYFKPPSAQWGQKVKDPAARGWFRANLDPVNNPGGAALIPGGNLVQMPTNLAGIPAVPQQNPAAPPGRLQEALSTLQSIGITVGTLPISAVTRTVGVGIGTAQLGKIGLQAAYRAIKQRL